MQGCAKEEAQGVSNKSHPPQTQTQPFNITCIDKH